MSTELADLRKAVLNQVQKTATTTVKKTDTNTKKH